MFRTATTIYHSLGDHQPGLPGESMKYVALLRGVNVGGKNMLPMKLLAEMFSAAGCTDVRTYINSGNVVFSAPAKHQKKLPALIEKRIAEQFGFHVPVIVRSATQLAATVRGNPFLQAGQPEKALHVYFLAQQASPDAIARLDTHRSPGDRFHVAGGEVYLHLTNGVANMKLTNAYFDSRLATVCTCRNWATVLKLLEMTKV